jgi:Ricin-type beta-trefoil lectin domain
MRGTGSSRLARPAKRARLASALAGVGLCGLVASAVAAPPATAAPARSASLSTARPASVPVAVGASFVVQPRIAAGQPAVRQACATPSVPGQMACMALISTRATAEGRAASADVNGGAPAGLAFGPGQLQNAYGLSGAAAMAGGTETVAVVDAFNDPSASSDLAAYRSGYGLGPCDQSAGCLRILNQRGGTTNLPRSDASGGWELEESLDLDMVSAICPKCRIILVEANSASIADLATAERTALHSGANAVSNSWGSAAEFTGERAYDPDFYAPGVAITAAGGDDGYGTQYPAVSPYVTAVGGTTLTGTMGDWTQTAWNGTGSGCSELEPKPSWQTADASAPDGCLNRTENDVAAEADPNPGVWVYDTVNNSAQGAAGWSAVGGTSVGTPIVAAAYALADIVAGGPGHGLIAGTFPAAYPYQNAAQFTDVRGGSDGQCEPNRQYLCQAVTGFDGPTGLGTPNGTAGLTGPTAGQVTVIDPGTQVYPARTSIRLRLDVQPGSKAVALRSTGLSGLTVGGGILRGTAPPAAGVHNVTVTASAAGLASGSASFAVVVVQPIRARHPAAGAVRLAGGGECLTGAHFRTSAGTPVQIRRCAGRSAQDWKFVPGGAIAGTGRLEVNGRCLTVSTGGNGAMASIQRCVRGDVRQDWTYLAGGHLRNPAAGRCLAVHGKATSGRQVVIWSCGGAGTGWELPAAPVLSALPGRCLADPSGSTAAGTAIESSACSASTAQRWTVERDGAIVIAGKCLAVQGSSLLDGAAIELASCSRSAAQRWVRGPNGQLVNANSGRCLAIPGNSPAAGTRLIQDDCYSEPGEIWVIS